MCHHLFKDRSCEAQLVFKLSIQLKITLIFWSSDCHLPSAGITHVSHQVWFFFSAGM